MYRLRKEEVGALVDLADISDFMMTRFCAKGKAAWLTLAMYLEPGSPPSRANAQSMREAVATMPTVAKNWATMTIEAYTH